MTGITMQHVPYRGSAPAMQDLLSNRVQVMFDEMRMAAGQLGAVSLKTL
jgi:tripartite-type tricarboxylate transporter receptor subunit TctC